MCTKSLLDASTFLAAAPDDVHEVKDLAKLDEIENLPKFVGHGVQNETVCAGSNVVLMCHVKNLGKYTLAWVRADTRTILTIGRHVFTRDNRVSIFHHNREIWHLRIKNVVEEDIGHYKCELNTKPMMKTTGFLVVVNSTNSSATVRSPCPGIQ